MNLLQLIASPVRALQNVRPGYGRSAIASPTELLKHSVYNFKNDIVNAPAHLFGKLAAETSGAHVIPYIPAAQADHNLPYRANLQMAQPASSNGATSEGVPQIPQSSIQGPRVFYQVHPDNQPIPRIGPVLAHAPQPIATAPQPIRKVILQGTENPHWTIYSGPAGNKWYENDVTGLKLPFKGL